MASDRGNATRTWWKRATCALALLLASSCYQTGEEGELGGDSHFLRPCRQQSDCDGLPGFTCVAQLCQPPSAAAAPRIDDERAGGGAAASETSDSGSGRSGGSTDTGEPSPLTDATPLVLLLVDTSGSLERMADCECVTPGCEECLPDCARGDRNRFVDVLEALTGTFEDFTCDTLQRTPRNLGDDAFDLGYYLPYNRPAGTQRDDGLLDQYRDRLRFGVATFDGFDTWAGAPPLVPASEFDFDVAVSQSGSWSYSPERLPSFSAARLPGVFKYPNCTTEYFMDTGIRSAQADQGALRIASDPASALAVNGEIQRELLSVRPYGGTPIASALDDLYYLFAQDAQMASERARSGPRHVVLITDGYPDDDYRSFGCNCNVEGDPSDPARCGPPPLNDPSTMLCPYPRPEEAARALRCGADGASCGDGPVTQVHVVSFAASDPMVTQRSDEIAIAGGGLGAYHALDGAALRQALESIFAEILQ